MNKGPALHQLIHSLSKVEKRHFKRFAARHSNNSQSNYLLLFEAVAKMPSYDEAALRLAFEGSPMLNNFSVVKNYLHQMLLRCLRLIHKRTSVDMELRESLDHIELLHQRGLRVQAADLLRTALRKARKYEALPYLAELLRWKRRLTNVHAGKQMVTELNALEVEEIETLANLKRDAQLRSLRAQFQAIFSRQVDIRKPEIKERLDQLLGQTVLEEGPEELSFQSAVTWYFVQAYALRLQNQYEAYIDMLHALLETWEATPWQQERQAGLYLNALASYLDACLTHGSYNRFKEKWPQISQFKTKDPATLARAYYLGTHLEINHAFLTGELDSVLSHTGEIVKGLESNLKYLSKSIELSFLYNLAVLHFAAEDYSGSMVFLNRILNQGAVDVRQDIQEAARVLELITQYSKGNLVLMDSLLRALRRRHRLHPSAHVFERLVADHISRLCNMPEEQKRKAELNKLLKRLDEMLKEKEFIGCEEVMLWARSQLEQRPIRALLQSSEG